MILEVLSNNYLIYIDKIEDKKANYFKKEIKNIISGLKDSRYQIGY